jgi:protein dithiol oxidoreductase (disulfide-forming)
MKRTLAAIAAVLISITACGRQSPAPATPSAAPTEQTAPAQQTPTPAAPAAEGQNSESEQATASQESTDEGPEDRGDAALERLAALPADQQLPSGKWKAGTHYTPLVPAQSTSVAPGKVEVVEVFWYGCTHCNALEPFLASWSQNKPEFIEFVRVPVIWGPAHIAHARLFYILQTLNRLDLHQKVFDTIHKGGNMLVFSTEEVTRKAQLDFAKANGISQEDFDKAWSSFTVNAGLGRAKQLTERYRVEGVPLVVINGKYVTDVTKAGGPGQLIQLINDLAAHERKR